MCCGFAQMLPLAFTRFPTNGEACSCWKEPASYTAQHFALIDNDCVPVTLFEVQDLIELAHQQLQWVDLLGRTRSESHTYRGIGMLLFTEAHLEYNAGLVISIGNRHKSSPMENEASSAVLARDLQAYRLALVSRARPPVTPSEAALTELCSLPLLEYQCKLPLIFA